MMGTKPTKQMGKRGGPQIPSAIEDGPDEMRLAGDDEAGAQTPAAGETGGHTAAAPEQNPELADLKAQLAAVGDPQRDMEAATRAYVSYKLAHERAVKDGEKMMMELQTAKRRAESDGNRRLDVIRVLRLKIAALGG